MKQYGLLFFVLIPCLLSAQGIVLDGYIGDSSRQELVLYATVALYDAQTNKLLNGSMTDEQGYYKLEGVLPGQYYIEASCLGYQKTRIDSIQIRLSSLSYAMNIFMSLDTKILEGVVIEGEKALIEMRPDKKILNIDKATASSGVSIAQALSVLPEIQVSANTITLKDASFTVLIDGKPSGYTPEQLLQLPANLLQSAEVITNPSVRYNSEGVGGIINLKMKKTLYGFNGMVQASGGTNLNANGIITLNYRTKKWNTYLNLWDRFEGADNKGFYEVLNADSSRLFQDFAEKSRRNRLSSKLGIEYDVNKNHYLSLYYLFSFKRGKGTSLFNEAYKDRWQETQTKIERSVYDRALDHQMAFNYTYQKQEKSLLTLDFLYSDLDQPNSFEFIEEGGDGYGQNLHYKGKTVDANLYYSRLLTTFLQVFELKLEAMLSGQMNDEKTDYSNFDTEGSLVFYHHNKAAAAIQLSALANDMGVYAGVKAEYHDNKVHYTDTVLNHRKFPKFIWAASMFIRPAEGLEFSLGGSSRIKSPSFIQVSPLYIFDDNNTSRIVGNPKLESAYTNSCELNLNYANPNRRLRLNAILGYSSTKKDFNAIYYMEDDNYYTSWNNLAKSQKIFLYSSINYKFIYFMRAGLSFNLRNDIFKAESQDRASHFNYDLKALLNFFTNNGFHCDISGTYTPKTYFYNSTRDAFFDLRLSLSMTIKRFTFSLGAYNLLNKYPKVHSQGETYIASNFVNYNTRSLHLGLMYSFGRKIENRSNLDLNTNKVFMED